MVAQDAAYQSCHWQSTWEVSSRVGIARSPSRASINDFCKAYGGWVVLRSLTCKWCRRHNYASSFHHMQKILTLRITRRVQQLSHKSMHQSWFQHHWRNLHLQIQTYRIYRWWYACIHTCLLDYISEHHNLMTKLFLLHTLGHNMTWHYMSAWYIVRSSFCAVHDNSRLLCSWWLTALARTLKGRV